MPLGRDRGDAQRRRQVGGKFVVERVHVAVVGYGYWGSKHVRVLSTMPDVAVSVVDADKRRREEAEALYPSIRRTAGTIDEVLDEVDAVLVATPPGSHYDVAMRALSAGKHVLVEKPLATSVDDAEAMVAAADDNDVQLMVGHTFEYNPAVRKLREIVRSGELGRMLYIDSARLSLGLYQRDVNVIWDLAPHDISIASYLLDELPVATLGLGAPQHRPGQDADVAYLRLEFPSTHAFVHVSWLNPQQGAPHDRRRASAGWPSTTTCRTTSASASTTSASTRRTIDDPHIGPRDAGDLPDRATSSRRTSRSGSRSWCRTEHFVDCVRTGVRSATPGERGLDIVRVLAATDVSHRRPGRSHRCSAGLQRRAA